jgi:hypothetical protein
MMHGDVIGYLLNWLPLFALVGAWVYFMKTFKGTRTQVDHMSEAKAQTATQVEIARHLDRIATALEKRP